MSYVCCACCRLFSFMIRLKKLVLFCAGTRPCLTSWTSSTQSASSTTPTRNRPVGIIHLKRRRLPGHSHPLRSVRWAFHINHVSLSIFKFRFICISVPVLCEEQGISLFSFFCRFFNVRHSFIHVIFLRHRFVAIHQQPQGCWQDSNLSYSSGIFYNCFLTVRHCSLIGPPQYTKREPLDLTPNWGSDQGAFCLARRRYQSTPYKTP